MFSNLRSLIFKLDPEMAHSLAIKSLKFNLIPNILDEEKNNPLFKTKLFNKEIENPIGMAAGFDKNAEVYNSLFNLGFGFVEVGTVTPLKQYYLIETWKIQLAWRQDLIKMLRYITLYLNWALVLLKLARSHLLNSMAILNQEFLD